ncbi:MAG: argininosuccinate lyase [Rhodobacteraceae bacterium]|nr:argininosuccinate lyase [Paracoccaceae bacterium]
MNSKRHVSAIWGARFSAGPEKIMEEMNASIRYDKRLYRQDIAGSQAHAAMLARQGIIAAKDADAISHGLVTILSEIENGTFQFRDDLEDIHMNVEARLAELIGPAAGRLHTARSRNDQVATDFRLWIRDRIDLHRQQILDLVKVLVDRARQHAETVMPGFTHLQNAQPITVGHHLMCYVEMFGRDRDRFGDCRKRLNECPLGTAALAGTSFPIDRDGPSRELGFDRPCANSLDAVSDRDFALEYLAANAICSVHLSRLAEEIVLWSSTPFGYATLGDGFTTGSSIMPQKRNPDAAELVRARLGRVQGALTALLTVSKALPMAYSKDLQEDKEQVFDAADTLSLSLSAMSGILREIQFDKEVLRQAAGTGHATATDLADWLVREVEMPFREAHRVVGALVGLAEDAGCGLADLSLEQLQSVCKHIGEEAMAVLGVENSVASRRSYGGTAPCEVRRQIGIWEEKLKCAS